MIFIKPWCQWYSRDIMYAYQSITETFFVDYLANSEDYEDYHELYVELVQFIHKHLTQQENTAKFEL